MSDDPHDDRQARFGEQVERARTACATLTGLPVDQARARVGEDPGLTLRELVPDQPVTLEMRAGRVNLVVEDGVVVQAWAG